MAATVRLNIKEREDGIPCERCGNATATILTLLLVGFDDVELQGCRVCETGIYAPVKSAGAGPEAKAA